MAYIKCIANEGTNILNYTYCTIQYGNSYRHIGFKKKNEDKMLMYGGTSSVTISDDNISITATATSATGTALVNGTLYTDDNGTTTSTHYNANSAMTISNNRGLTFIPD